MRHILGGLVGLGLVGSAFGADRMGLQYQIPAGEYQALVDLYESTGGGGWTDHAGWLDPEAPDWHGVRVTGVEVGWDINGDQYVVQKGWVSALFLANNGLKGGIPESLGLLTKVSTLSLFWNELTGPIPSSIGDLRGAALLDIDMGGNLLEGNLPGTMSGMTNLWSLDLSDNRLSGVLPDWLGTLSGLRTLDLAINGFSGEIPVSLSSLVGLGHLGLDYNRLSGSIPSELGQLSGLYWLLLDNNQLTGSIPLSLGGLFDGLAGFELGISRLTLQRNCLDLSNAASIASVLPVETTFTYEPQSGDCATSESADLRCVLFRVVEDAVNAGDPITLEFELENGGLQASGGFQVGFFLSGSAVEFRNRELLAVVDVASLGAGERSGLRTERVALPLEVWEAGAVSAPNQFFVGMVIDVSNQVIETDERNNAGHGVCSSVDVLEVSGPPVIGMLEFDAHHPDHLGEGFSPGETMVVEWELKNIGYGDSGAFELMCLFDDPPIGRFLDQVLAREAIGPGLVSGDTVGGVLMVQLPGADSSIYEPNGNGIYDVLPGLDPSMLEYMGFSVLGYEEEVYGDSVIISNLCADLVAMDVTVDLLDPTLRPGDEVPINLSVLNDSAVRVTGGGVVRVFLSRDTLIDPVGDRLVGELMLPVLEPHVTHEWHEGSIVLPGMDDTIWISGDHTYYLGLVVELPTGVTDCDSSNNKSSALTVASLNVNVVFYSVGSGVSDGVGTQESPYIVRINRSLGAMEADPGAEVYLGYEDLPAGGLLDFDFSAVEGSGILYICVDGSIPTVDRHDYAVAYSGGSAHEFLLESGSGSVQVFLVADGGLSGGELRLESVLEGPPAVSVLMPTDMSTVSTNYGACVAVSGDVVAIGDWKNSALGEGAGLVHVFRWNGEEWVESRVTVGGHRAWLGFGYALALDGDRLVVSAKGESGWAYAFEWDGMAWVQTATMRPGIMQSPGGGVDIGYGPFVSMALDGETTVLGSPEFHYWVWDTLAGMILRGAVFRFEHAGGVWSEDSDILHQGLYGGGFGQSVAISGDVMLVGDPEQYGSPANSDLFNGMHEGAVWVYRREGDTWQESLFGQWEYPDYSFNRFGVSVALQGDLAVIGAPGRGDSAGEVHLREWDGASWVASRMSPGDSQQGDLFGSEVSLGGGRLAVSSGRGIYLYERGLDGWGQLLWHGVEEVPTPWRQYHAALSGDGGLLVVGEADDRVVFVGGVTNVAPPSAVTVYNLRDGFGSRGADALLARYFTEAEVEEGRLAIQQGDPDGDGQATLMELLAGTDPLVASSVQSPLSWREEAGELVVEVRRHSDASGLSVVLMASANLVDWVQAGGQPVLTSSDPITGGQLWEVGLPMQSAGGFRAYRLVVRD